MPLPTGLQVGSTSNTYDYAVTVTTSDTVDFGVACRALYIYHTATCTVTVRMQNGDSVLFSGIPANSGYILPVRATRVFVTGTTASAVVALY